MEMLKAAFTLHFDDRTKPSFAVSEARVLNHYDAPSVDKMLTVALTRENRSRRDYEVTSVRYFDNDFNAWVNVSLTDHHVHLREYEVHLEKIEVICPLVLSGQMQARLYYRRSRTLLSCLQLASCSFSVTHR